MPVDLNLNNSLMFASKKRNFLSRKNNTDHIQDSFSYSSQNKRPGLDNKSDGTIGIIQRIKNVKTYFHNAMLMQSQAYNWGKQIENAKLLHSESRDAYCDFLNLKSEARTSIYDKIQVIKSAKEDIDLDSEVHLKNGSRIKFEFIDDDNQHYVATLFNKFGEKDIVYNQWDEKNVDVDSFLGFNSDDIFKKEFSFVDGKLTAVQVQCKEQINDSSFEDDFIWEKDYYQNDNTLTVIYKRNVGQNFDKKFVFENKTISSIKRSSDSQARFVSEYLFENNGLTQINVESYEDVVNRKYPVKTVKTLYCDSMN